MKFRKKPVVIEAFCIGLHEEPNWFIGSPFVERYKHQHCDSFCINTLEGKMTANFGDWVIKGVKGELYPCKPDIFEMTYEAVNE